MYKEITLATVQGELKTFPFLANATTAIRFRQVFHKELLGSITWILTNVGIGQLKELMNAAQAAEAEGKTEVNLDEMDPKMVDIMIRIVGSGDLESIQQMAYIMHEQAIKADMNALSYSGYVEWLESFDTMEFLTHAMEFISIYMGQKESMSTLKKDSAQPSVK